LTPDIPPAKIPVVVLYNIDPEWTNEEKDEVIRLSTELNDALQKTGYPTVAVAIENENIAASLRPFDPAGYIIFNWCEGLPGVKNSEWLVVKNLERLGYTFTGADSDTLLLAYDKQKIKIILDQAAVPTPAWQVFNATDAGNWEIFPAIVKPQNEHCSAGITPESVVMNKRDLNKRISYILETYQQSALVEDFIDGREFHVTVLGNETLSVLPAAEMDFARFTNLSERLCTYDAKFIPGSQHYEEIQTLLPAPLTQDEKKILEKVCCDAYRATGCRDYARMDIRLRDDVFYVLDVNPNADISSDASMACAAEEAGISYARLGSLIVQMAALRHPVLQKLR
jgi:D-alanine-D-alanine ligase